MHPSIKPDCFNNMNSATEALKEEKSDNYWIIESDQMVGNSFHIIYYEIALHFIYYLKILFIYVSWSYIFVFQYWGKRLYIRVKIIKVNWAMLIYISFVSDYKTFNLSSGNITFSDYL